MRVIFVGVHNKPGLVPLCNSTKSGRLIDRVALEIGCRWIKTNLYDVDYLPLIYADKVELARDWQYKTNLATGDIVVLLGKEVHENFINSSGVAILKFAHPASKWSHVAMDEYVNEMVNAIRKEQANNKRNPFQSHQQLI